MNSSFGVILKKKKSFVNDLRLSFNRGVQTAKEEKRKEEPLSSSCIAMTTSSVMVIILPKAVLKNNHLKVFNPM